jgi:hypothetical protein
VRGERLSQLLAGALRRDGIQVLQLIDVRREDGRPLASRPQTIDFAYRLIERERVDPDVANADPLEASPMRPGS